MNTFRFASILALLLAGVCACAAQAAPPADKHRPETSGLDVDARISGTITAGISIGDARRLATQHGLTGGKPLPPGIRKNLARGKPLPPGIQKTRMPDAFVSQLPQHPGHEWRQAGADLVLVASGSLVISDILEGVFD